MALKTAADPSRPSNPNEDHTTKSGTKPATGIEVITDTTFAPTLDSAPPTRYLQSFLVLSLMIACAAIGAWFLELDIFEATGGQWLIIGAVVLSLWYTGVVWIDWWAVIIEYWWLSLPVLAGMGIAVIRMDEATRGLDEVD